MSHLYAGSASCSVVSDSLGPHGQQPTRLLFHGILQARILEWVAIPFSGGSSQPRNQTRVSRIAGRFFTVWATSAFYPYAEGFSKSKSQSKERIRTSAISAFRFLLLPLNSYETRSHKKKYISKRQRPYFFLCKMATQYDQFSKALFCSTIPCFDSSFLVLWICFLIYEKKYFPPFRISEFNASITCVRAESLQSCLTLWDPINCTLLGSSVHEILHARILEWVAMPSSRESSWPRDWTRVSYVSCIGRWVLDH